MKLLKLAIVGFLITEPTHAIDSQTILLVKGARAKFFCELGAENSECEKTESLNMSKICSDLDKQGLSPIADAAYNWQYFTEKSNEISSYLDELLGNGCAIDGYSLGYTGLNYSVMQSNFPAVEYFLNNSANPDFEIKQHNGKKNKSSIGLSSFDMVLKYHKTSRKVGDTVLGDHRIYKLFSDKFPSKVPPILEKKKTENTNLRAKFGQLQILKSAMDNNLYRIKITEPSEKISQAELKVWLETNLAEFTNCKSGLRLLDNKNQRSSSGYTILEHYGFCEK